jgi:hypothetical protein
MNRDSPAPTNIIDKMRRERAATEEKWQAKVSRRRAERHLPLLHGDYTVLYLPGMEKMALGVAEQLGDDLPVLCTDDMFAAEHDTQWSETGLVWERFPSGDPDIKMRIELVRDRHVVLVMNHDTVNLFEQLAIILFLQRFNVPHALDEYAKGKWKKTSASNQ